MEENLFSPFRLVGGTNLSLRYGHRHSDDIDLFTDAEYGSLDFGRFEKYLKSNFPYYSCTDKTSIIGFGRGYYIGNSETDSVKLDLMYTDQFLNVPDNINGIRMASVNDIIAMKMNTISRGGRKKDFWDLHLLLERHKLKDMMVLHSKRHEWEHDEKEMIERLTDFSIADEMPDPICLLGKEWDNIKLDITDHVIQYQEQMLSN